MKIHTLVLLPALAACSMAAPAAAPSASPEPAPAMTRATMAMPAGATIPVGTYHSTMAPSDIPAGAPDEMKTGLVGNWDITVHGPTHAVVNVNGRQVVGAPFTLNGNEIDFSAEDTGEYACHDAGRYTWSMDGGMLHFTKIEDACAGRAAVLTAHPWSM